PASEALSCHVRSCQVTGKCSPFLPASAALFLSPSLSLSPLSPSRPSLSLHLSLSISVSLSISFSLSLSLSISLSSLSLSVLLARSVTRFLTHQVLHLNNLQVQLDRKLNCHYL